MISMKMNEELYLRLKEEFLRGNINEISYEINDGSSIDIEFTDNLGKPFYEEYLLDEFSEWNKKFSETIIQQTIPMEISEFKNSNEFQWLETNYPITRYQETIGDRKKREALINQKIDFPLVWNSDVYNNKLSDYLMNNESNQVGLKMVYETIKPEFKKIYEFDLGKGKYGEYYSDKKEQEFPEDLELTFTGILYVDWDGNLKSGDLDWTYENPVTLCDCMTKGNDYSTPGTFTFRFCEARFLEFFGTKSPDIKNYWVKKKYDECMYKKN